jgi:hypothetical protein
MYPGEHSGNIQETFREHPGNIQGTCREHSGNIQYITQRAKRKVRVRFRES